jgi:hypothetical protein
VSAQTGAILFHPRKSAQIGGSPFPPRPPREPLPLSSLVAAATYLRLRLRFRFPLSGLRSPVFGLPFILHPSSFKLHPSPGFLPPRPLSVIHHSSFCIHNFLLPSRFPVSALRSLLSPPPFILHNSYFILFPAPSAPSLCILHSAFCTCSAFVFVSSGFKFQVSALATRHKSLATRHRGSVCLLSPAPCPSLPSHFLLPLLHEHCR